MASSRRSLWQPPDYPATAPAAVLRPCDCASGSSRNDRAAAGAGKLLAAEVLVIGVLDPPLAHRLVAEVVGVFENGEPRHQPRRQRRLAGAILVNLAEFLFQKSPVDRPRQLRQRMIHVDDLIEPRTKHILLA